MPLNIYLDEISKFEAIISEENDVRQRWAANFRRKS